MEPHVTKPEEAGAGSPGGAYDWPVCPDCGPVELVPVYAGDAFNSYCPLCGGCWHFAGDSAIPVDPATCPGCHVELVCRERRQLAGR